MDKDFLSKIKVEPLTRNNWGKFLKLFGKNGAGANCWCMHFRLPKGEYDESKAAGENKNAIKQLVWNGKPTGVIGFYEDIPVAWCAFSPREDFRRLEKSRVHKPIDNKKVWSVPCMYIKKEYRKIGLSVTMLKGLVDYAKKEGINIVEAYPTIPTQEKLPDGFAWIGLYKSFKRAGFKIVDTTSKHRPMVRYEI